MITGFTNNKMKIMKKNKKICRSAIAFFCAMVLFLMQFKGYAFADDNASNSETAEFELKTFDELEVYEFTDEEIYELIDRTDEELGKKDNDEKVEQCINELYDYACKLSFNSQYYTVCSEKNIFDEEIEKLTIEADVRATEMRDAIYGELSSICDTSYSDVIENMVPEKEYEYLLDYVENDVKFIKVEEKLDKLRNEYDKLLSKDDFSTTYDGVKYDMEKANDALEEGDIEIEDFIAIYSEILKVKNETLGEYYIKMIELEKEYAKLRGYDDVIAMEYEDFGRDYDYEDLSEFEEQVKDYYAPLYVEMEEEIYDIESESFYDEMPIDDVIEKVRKRLEDISPKLMEAYDVLVEYDLLDIEPSDIKSDRMSTIPLNGLKNYALIVGNGSGNSYDINSLIHEFGHFNHIYHANYGEIRYNIMDLDLHEVYSKGLEVLAYCDCDSLYGDAAEYAEFFNSYGFVSEIVECTIGNEFEKRAYQEENLTVERLNEIYFDIIKEYGVEYSYDSTFIAEEWEDYTCIPKGEAYEWASTNHFMHSPFYYISYALSGACVEEIRDIAESDIDAAVDTYLDIVYADHCQGFERVIEDAGLNNPIDSPRLWQTAYSLREELGLDIPYELSEAMKNADSYSDIDGKGLTKGKSFDDSNDSDEDDAAYVDAETSKSKKDYDGDRNESMEEGVINVIAGFAIAFLAFVAVIVIIAIVMVFKTKKNRTTYVDSANINPTDSPYDKVNEPINVVNVTSFADNSAAKYSQTTMETVNEAEVVAGNVESEALTSDSKLPESEEVNNMLPVNETPESVENSFIGNSTDNA